MNTKEYNRMIYEAVREFEDMNVSYKGLLLSLVVLNDHVKYVHQDRIIKAKERIEVLRHLKSLNLLK